MPPLPNPSFSSLILQSMVFPMVAQRHRVAGTVFWSARPRLESLCVSALGSAERQARGSATSASGSTASLQPKSSTTLTPERAKHITPERASFFIRQLSQYSNQTSPKRLADPRPVAAGTTPLSPVRPVPPPPDDRALEEEAEKKFGWILKIFFLGTAGLVGYQFFPYMGDNLLLQSISLLRVKDPLFKRMGASRLARFAVDDGRRMKVVEMGGAQELLNVLEGAKDDKTRKEVLKALIALSKSEEAARFLDKAGAYAIVSSSPDPKSPEFAEIETYKTNLLNAFDQLKS